MTEGASQRELGRLYLVATPRPEQDEAEFLSRIEAGLAGGVDTVQLRCKPEDPRYAEARPYIALAEQVRDLAHAHNVPFFVDDRVDVAVAAGADGVHLGQRDLPTRWARDLAPRLMVLYAYREVGGDVSELNIGHVVRRSEIWLAASKDVSDQEARRWQEGFEQVRADGTYDAILARYTRLKPQPVPENRRSTEIQWFN